MSRWEVKGPVARVRWAEHDWSFSETLARLPGLKNKGGEWLVPYNALPLVDLLAQTQGHEVASVSWAAGAHPQAPVTWPEIEQQLKEKGEVESFVLDGYLMPYQREALVHGWHRAGVHYWHPTGCLTGDTLLTVNRAGKSFRISLAQLARKFHGGESGRWGSGYVWNPGIPTRTQSEVDGFLRLNTILDVFETGEKEVFTVKVGDKSLKATKDHKFLTPDGFKRLGELSPGDLVMIEGPPGGGRKAKPRYKQKEAKNHPFAAVVESRRSDAWCKKRRYKPGYIERHHRVPEHRLVAEARLNGLDLCSFLHRVRSGEVDGLKFLDPSTHAVHHKDRDRQNNRPENLEVVTHEEHFRLHGQQEGWQNGTRRAVAKPIDSIELYGTTTTYDMTMASPHNNYVANGFVVHNSGKTLTGILCGLSVLGPLVIVTRAASRIQYGREVEKFTRLRAYVLRPESQMRKRSKRIEEYLAECVEKQARPVVITSWESLQDNLALLSDLRPGAVIYDESHRGKDSKRWEVVPLPETSEDPDELLKQKAIWEREAKAKDGFVKKTDDGWRMFVPYVSTATAAAQLARAAHKRICTTATPIKDRVRDLYGQLDLAEPNAWGSATDWLNRYADRKPGIYGGYDTRGSSNIEELNLRLQTVAHILDYRETHRDLPAKRRQSVYVPAEDQCRPSAGFNKELREASKRGPGAMLEVKLARAASMKRTAVLALVESHVDSNQKVVVFTGRKEDCEKLGEQVRKNASVKNKKASVWVSHGGDSTKMRQAIIDEYMSHPGPCVLVATGHAFGESLNLHDTDAALFVMLPYDPGQFRQWEGRFTRLGQKRPVVIYYVIAEGTVDERIAGILIDKLPAVEKIAKDEELAAAGDVLAGYDGMDKDTFAESVLADLDLEGLE